MGRSPHPDRPANPATWRTSADRGDLDTGRDGRRRPGCTSGSAHAGSWHRGPDRPSLTGPPKLPRDGIDADRGETSADRPGPSVFDGPVTPPGPAREPGYLAHVGRPGRPRHRTRRPAPPGLHVRERSRGEPGARCTPPGSRRLRWAGHHHPDRPANPAHVGRETRDRGDLDTGRDGRDGPPSKPGHGEHGAWHRRGSRGDLDRPARAVRLRWAGHPTRTGPRTRLPGARQGRQGRGSRGAWHATTTAARTGHP